MGWDNVTPLDNSHLHTLIEHIESIGKLLYKCDTVSRQCNHPVVLYNKVVVVRIGNPFTTPAHINSGLGRFSAFTGFSLRPSGFPPLRNTETHNPSPLTRPGMK